MKKILFYILLTQAILYSCATCSFMIPTADVGLKIPIQNNKLQKIEVLWHFSDVYTSELTLNYDKNKNLILDKEELDKVLEIKLGYLVPKNMLTLIKYGDSDHENIIDATYDDFSVEVVDKRLLFRFNIFVDIDIKDKHIISFLFEDDEAFFSFIVENVDIQTKDLYFLKNLYLFSTALFFSFDPIENTLEIEDTKMQSHTISKDDVVINDEIVEQEEPQQQDEGITQENLLLQTIEKLKSLFKEADESKKPLTYLLILLFAYVYGLVHAIGPGHGKTLVASYFLSNDRSYTKAFFISLAIGVVHTFSAFLLTLLIYFVVETFLAQFMQNTIMLTTKVSAFVIIAIALYLLYKKLKAYRAKKSMMSFSTTPHESSCGCGSCKVDQNSTDLALIVSAGIIPCPGTVTIFIFSLSMGMYFLGFLSAFVMSLGMSTIIFLSAIISVSVRKKTSQKHTKIQIILEYLSLALIFILGIVLFFST
ncbi:MAG: DUF1007 family protein [Sulfurimonas sp.]|uniref:HoxN/HupN/NixA family nickel/cobalt transporter n=1 Tax=Sulfurimonas sp. TaxID=2022749 RepID=UPI0025D1388B|nr:DUF1007 family protein [Sulfurimonas sp.]MCK9492344.1 DUF1007 family protein [Sulfurimonas sp.]